MKNKKEIKKPSILSTILVSGGLIILGSVLAITVTPVMFLLGSVASITLIIRNIKKFLKYSKLEDEGKLQDIEKKEGLFSKIKNKFKSKKKTKKKEKNIESKKPKKDSITNNNQDNNISENIDRNVTSNDKIKNIKKKKEELEQVKRSIIDGTYGLKKDEIIQDRVNGKEIAKFYKKTLKK